MSESIFYPLWQGASGFFSNIRNAVLGKPGGKFTTPAFFSTPINEKTILVDVSPNNLMAVACGVPHLNTVLDKGGEYFSLMEIKHLDKNGEEIPLEKSKVLQFLKQPNPLQSQEDYLYELYVMHGIYNKTFQRIIKGLSFEKLPKAMWVLPSGYMKLNATGKIYGQTKVEEIIESFEMLDEQNTNYKTEEIIYMAAGIGSNVLDPVSKLVALQIPLSNIQAALKSRNITITQLGSKGFISPDGGSKDGDGALPYDKKEHERIRKEYQQQYHLDSTGGHISFSTNPIKFTPISFPLSDLRLEEGNEESFAAIVAAYGHDRDIYPSVKGATFENKAQGMRATIQNALQPLADKIMRHWTKQFIDPASGERLEASYDYLPCMQENKEEEARAKSTDVMRYSKLHDDGIITREQYASLAGVDLETVPEVSGPQNKLRGLVGSATGIIQINQFVATGFIDKPTAVNMIMSIYGYDVTAANAMITNNTVDVNTPAPTIGAPPKE